jgi:hypothetical protein
VRVAGGVAQGDPRPYSGRQIAEAAGHFP